FNNDPSNVDYLLITPSTKETFRTTDNEFALAALDRSSLVRSWESEGSRVELWRTDDQRGSDRRLLDRSYAYLEQRFEEAGAYLDDEGRLTSEAQSYALLRAVWSDRPDDFARVWERTRATLQRDDGLFAWLWRDGKIRDDSSATDADTDIALALLLAGERWDDQGLIDDGTRIVAAIWENEVIEVGGIPYVVAGDWVSSDRLVLNPSYCSPHAYRVFAEVDPSHDWYGAIDSCYDVLFRASEDPLGARRSAGLPPNWVALDPATGALESLDDEFDGAGHYGYDAARTYWRIALDLRWGDDGRARSYLEQAGFLADEVERNGYVGAVYSHDGDALEPQPSTVSTAGALGALEEIDEAGADELYARAVLGKMDRSAGGSRWGDGTDLYEQEWGWFAVALHGDEIPNLWFE
ncbi:MAG: glycosyl hydrolase family 8, partial [Actinomycetota bacterium]